MLLETQIATFITNLNKITGITTAFRGVYIPMNFEQNKFPLVFVSTQQERLTPGVNPLDETPDEEQDISVYISVFNNSEDFETGYADLVALQPKIYAEIIKSFCNVGGVTMDRETPFMRLGDFMNRGNTPPYYSMRFDFTIRKRGQI